MKSEKYQHETTYRTTKEELKTAIQNLKDGEALSVNFPMSEEESGRKRDQDEET